LSARLDMIRENVVLALPRCTFKYTIKILLIVWKKFQVCKEPDVIVYCGSLYILYKYSCYSNVWNIFVPRILHYAYL